MLLLEIEKYSAPGSGVSCGVDSIIPSMDSGNLSEEERVVAWEAFGELNREGLIMRKPGSQFSYVFNILTKEGKEYAKELKEKGMDFKRPKLHLKDIVSDDRLMKACRDAFVAGNYWDAIFNAQRHLEVRVKEKSGLDLQGQDLMATSFSTDKPKLDIKATDDVEEKKGFRFIMMGMAKFHRNQKAHNEGAIGIESAYQIIGYVDYLLKVVKESELIPEEEE